MEDAPSSVGESEFTRDSLNFLTSRGTWAWIWGFFLLVLVYEYGTLADADTSADVCKRVGKNKRTVNKMSLRKRQLLKLNFYIHLIE